VSPPGGYGKDCVETCEETNTGDPKVLKNFMLWAIEKYPANRHLLILWNHGGGIVGPAGAGWNLQGGEIKRMAEENPRRCLGLN